MAEGISCENVESLVLRHFTCELSLAISADLCQVVTKLFAKYVISPEQHREAMLETKTKQNRASELVINVITHVRSTPKKYCIFLQALRESDIEQKVVKDVHDKYEEEKLKSKEEPNPDVNHEHKLPNIIQELERKIESLNTELKQSLRSAYNEGSTRREEELKRELDVKLCEKNAEICELKAEICEKNGEICEKEEEIKALKTRLSLANDCTEVLARSAMCHENQPGSTNAKPSTPCHRRLLDETISVAYKWKNLGLVLDLDYSTLQEIEANYGGARRCLEEVLYSWLKGNGGEVSWSALCEALRSKLVERSSLAAEIELKHFCGV